ncbi:unnamed protein product [Brachionus calyciflorus]|uniref:Uncharacterized protein n=1 Tax=Brachionus calyciflorus TaxID=104777 RepID=A0A814I7C2_9BILA|nr:unnamed protein product [Brachionus calyciflorus]
MSLFNTLLFLVIIQAELYLQYPKQNQIPTTTPVLNITEEIIQILERKLQIKISWNVSNSCDLLPLFESLNFNANCDLNKVNLDFLIGYRFEEGLKTLPFHHLNLDDSKETIIKAIRFPTRSILFEWNPSFNHLEFVSNVCTGAWSRSKCFKELHTDIQILLRIMEENLMEIYFRNETFSHEFLDKYRIIFTRENDGFDYIDSKIIIELMNTSIISLPFNITQGYVIYDSSELAGQLIKVHFRAVWKGNFHHLENLNETLGLEINSNIFTLEPIKKRPQSYVVYNTNMTVNDLRTLSNPILINIRKLNLIKKIIVKGVYLKVILKEKS